MANMSYCKFENTVKDLRDCDRGFEECESIEEAKARYRLLKLCHEMAENYDLESFTVEQWKLTHKDYLP